jgi:hypothetical protein
MRRKRNSHSAALAMLTVFILVAAVGCAREGNDWQEATSATGNYVIDFPEPPKTDTMKVPNSDVTVQVTLSEADTGYYALAETPLNGINPNPLDFAVDSSIEGARTKLAAASSGSAKASEVSRTTGDFEGVETRRYRAYLTADGVDYELNGLAFYREDAFVNALVVTDADIHTTFADRFLSSLKSKPEPDIRALPERFLEIGDQVVGVLDAQ